MKTKLYIVQFLILCLLYYSCGEPLSTVQKRQETMPISELGIDSNSTGKALAIHGDSAVPLDIGFGFSLDQFELDTLIYFKSVGVDHLEASGINLLVDAKRNLKLSDVEIKEKLIRAKEAVDKAGVNIWSIHMPFGPEIDLSLADEQERQEVVVMHKKLLGYLKILEPEVILFHPSYYLGVGERELRKDQLMRSVFELDREVRAMGAIMVLENMLGPDILKDETRESPLLRSVKETQDFFERLPASIGLAVDTNHITRAEELILALGNRLKTLHIADGTGLAENHWFPCYGKGENDWNKILSALEQVNYSGPFMFESSPGDAEEYLPCYRRLYQNYLNSK